MGFLARWRSQRSDGTPAAPVAATAEPPSAPVEPVEPVEPEPVLAAPVDEAGTDLPGDPRSVIRVQFRDPAITEALADDGYARIGPFLDAAEVAAANAVFDEARRMLDAPLGDAWFPTILLPDDAVRAHITQGLSELIVPKLAGLVDPESLELVRLDYSVKPASEASELGPHQDFALVDERAAQSLYFWIPLCDTDEVNGTLHVVPGSHRFTNRIRSRHVPSVFDEVIGEVHEASTRLDCRAGELIVMVSGIIHWSPPNRSSDLRLAAHGIVKPAGLPLVFYFQDDDTPPDLVACYEFDIERYVRAIHQGPPEGEPPLRYEHRPPGSMTPTRFAAGLAGRAATLDGPPASGSEPGDSVATAGDVRRDT